MNRFAAFGIPALLIVILVYGAVNGFGPKKQTTVSPKESSTNSAMLENGNTTAITTEDNVSYYEGAKGYFVRPEKDAAKVASLGWCFGGRQSVALAISGEKLDATVVYYGGNMASTVEELKPIKWPVLGIFGDRDQAIPAEKVKEFEASLATLGVENEIHIYPGVGHAFANPSGDNYAPNETKDAWSKTLTFLNKNLK